MITEKKFFLVLKNSAARVGKVGIVLISAQLFLMACSKEDDESHILTSYPSDLISTPIVTSDFSSAVAEAQTPIDIITSNLIPFKSNDPNIHYGAVTLNSVANNEGENLRVNVAGADSFNNYITVGGKQYNLVNFHFHYSSEHTINGAYSKMEIHFVNRSLDNSYAVLGVLVDSGNGNPGLQDLFNQSPTTPNAINSPNTTLDLSTLFPSNIKEYYTYSGSLTTPNFGANSSATDGGPVTWFVFKDKQQVSDAEFSTYKSVYTEPNFRTTRPLNGRKVYVKVND